MTNERTSGWGTFKKVAGVLGKAAAGAAANAAESYDKEQKGYERGHAKEYFEAKERKKQEKAASPWHLDGDQTKYVFNRILDLHAQTSSQGLDSRYDELSAKQDNPNNMILDAFAYCVSRRNKFPYSTTSDKLSRAYTEAMERAENFKKGGLEATVENAQASAPVITPSPVAPLTPLAPENKIKRFFRAAYTPLIVGAKKAYQGLEYLNNQQIDRVNAQIEKETKKKPKVTLPDAFIHGVFVPLLLESTKQDNIDPIWDYLVNRMGMNHQQAMAYYMRFTSEAADEVNRAKGKASRPEKNVTHDV